MWRDDNIVSVMANNAVIRNRTPYKTLLRCKSNEVHSNKNNKTGVIANEYNNISENDFQKSNNKQDDLKETRKHLLYTHYLVRMGFQYQMPNSSRLSTVR